MSFLLASGARFNPRTTAGITVRPPETPMRQGLIGVSFSRCVMTVAKGRVPMERIAAVVAAFSGTPKGTVLDDPVKMSEADLKAARDYERFFNDAEKDVARELQESGRLWRSTAFATPDGHGRYRSHGSFGSFIWIDSNSGALVSFSPIGHDSRFVEDPHELSPDEAALFVGLSELYPENPVFSDIKEVLASGSKWRMV